MITRLPSNQKASDFCWSGDPALQQPPVAPPDSADVAEKGRYAKELAAYERKIEIARERGAWDELVLPGMQPTKFVLKPLSGNVIRRLIDRAASGRIGGSELRALAFRLALESVENLDDYELPKAVHHPDFGPIAHDSVIDVLDAIDLRIVTELGGLVLTRAQGVSPKS